MKVMLKYSGISVEQLARLHEVLGSDSVRSAETVMLRHGVGSWGGGKAVFAELRSSILEGGTYAVEIELHPSVSTHGEYRDGRCPQEGELTCQASVPQAIHDALGVFPEEKQS